MARQVGGSIGLFKGRLGKVSARIINGETILSARPENFKESKNPKHAEVKLKFAVTSTFTSGVLELPGLYQIWKLNKIPGLSEFNMIFSRNFRFSSDKAPTIQNIITPDGFNSPFTSAEITAGVLKADLMALNTVTTISKTEVNLSVNAVISCSDPHEESDPFFKIASVSKEITNFNFSEACKIEMNLALDAVSTVGQYKQKIIYLAVAAKSAYNEIVNNSQSISFIAN
jgi:hypothetical protein